VGSEILKLKNVQAALMLFLAGLAWLVVGMASASQTNAKSSRASKAYQVVLRGTIPSASHGKDLCAHIHFPGVPFDVIRTGDRLALDRDGRFDLDFDVISPTRPDVLELELRTPDGYAHLTNLPLVEDGNHLSCTLPQLSLSPPEQPDDVRAFIPQRKLRRP
jgi:hypothetical protein